MSKGVIIKNWDDIKIGDFIIYDNGKEIACGKVTHKTKVYFPYGDIDVKVGKIETVFFMTDIIKGHLYKSKTKKTFYKKLIP